MWRNSTEFSKLKVSVARRSLTSNRGGGLSRTEATLPQWGWRERKPRGSWRSSWTVSTTRRKNTGLWNYKSWSRRWKNLTFRLEMSQLHSDIARMQKMFTSILKYASRNNIPIPQVTSGDLYRLTLSQAASSKILLFRISGWWWRTIRRMWSYCKLSI